MICPSGYDSLLLSRMFSCSAKQVFSLFPHPSTQNNCTHESMISIVTVTMMQVRQVSVAVRQDMMFVSMAMRLQSLIA